MVLLDTGTPGTNREIYSEDADGETRTRNPSSKSTISDCWYARDKIANNMSDLSDGNFLRI